MWFLKRLSRSSASHGRHNRVRTILASLTTRQKSASHNEQKCRSPLDHITEIACILTLRRLILVTYFSIVCGNLIKELCMTAQRTLTALSGIHRKSFCFHPRIHRPHYRRLLHHRQNHFLRALLVHLSRNRQSQPRQHFSVLIQRLWQNFKLKVIHSL